MNVDEKVKVLATVQKETLMIFEQLVSNIESKYRIDLSQLANDLADQRDKLYALIHDAP